MHTYVANHAIFVLKMYVLHGFTAAWGLITSVVGPFVPHGNIIIQFQHTYVSSVFMLYVHII